MNTSISKEIKLGETKFDLNNPHVEMFMRGLAGDGLTSISFQLGLNRLRKVFDIKDSIATINYSKMSPSWAEEYFPGKPHIELSFKELSELCYSCSEPSVDSAYMTLLKLSEGVEQNKVKCS